MRPTLAIVLGVVACCCGGLPSVPPPPSPALADPSFPSAVREVEIDHGGCFGTCPIYRVSVANTGRFEYEGKKFVRDVGQLSGSIDHAEIIGVFSWLEGHAAVYAPRPTKMLIPDAEVTTYRFLMKNGDTVAFQVNDEEGELWVLSRLVDAVIGRALRPAT